MLEEPQYVCHACIQDKFLAKQVKIEGTLVECSYCHATKAAFTLADLSKRIHQVLEEHFETIPEDESRNNLGKPFTTLRPL